MAQRLVLRQSDPWTSAETSEHRGLGRSPAYDLPLGTDGRFELPIHSVVKPSVWLLPRCAYRTLLSREDLDRPFDCLLELPGYGVRYAWVHTELSAPCPRAGIKALCVHGVVQVGCLNYLATAQSSRCAEFSTGRAIPAVKRIIKSKFKARVTPRYSDSLSRELGRLAS